MKESKNAVVTGASTGIGYATCKELNKQGFTVFATVRRDEDAKRLRTELGAMTVPVIMDVTDHGSIARALAQISKEIGQSGIHALINNAGIAVSGPLLHIPIDEVKHQFDVNVIGLVRTIQLFAPLLGARENHPVKPGRIINISSVSGKIGMPFVGPYTGSKHALEGISQSLRRELMLYGIDVIVIGPGAIKTPIWGKSTMMDKYSDTDYKRPLERFMKNFVKPAIEKAIEVDVVAEMIGRVVKSDHPKTRYAIMSQKIKNYILPKMLPERMVNRIIAKALKMV